MSGICQLMKIKGIVKFSQRTQFYVIFLINFVPMQEILSIDGFLSFFPEVDLPVTLSEEYVQEFSINNVPLNLRAIDDWITQWEGPLDEVTEYIPCFKIKETFDIHAIVYWKAGLMTYEYIMITLDKQGNLIDRKVVSSTRSDGKTIKRSIASIDEDWIIHIIAGENDEHDLRYEATKSKAFNMELMVDGRIIFNLVD